MQELEEKKRRLSAKVEEQAPNVAAYNQTQVCVCVEVCVCLILYVGKDACVVIVCVSGKV